MILFNKRFIDKTLFEKRLIKRTNFKRTKLHMLLTHFIKIEPRTFKLFSIIRVSFFEKRSITVLKNKYMKYKKKLVAFLLKERLYELSLTEAGISIFNIKTMEHINKI